MRIAIGVVLLAAALVAAEPQAEPFGVGVLRRDGVIIPFAAYDGKRWSHHWPVPAADLTVPIDLRSLPSKWWGPAPAADIWTAWPGKASGGVPQPVKATQHDWVDTHCLRQIGVRTITNRRAAAAADRAALPEGWSRRSTAQRVEPIIWLSTLAPELARPLSSGAFNRAERKPASRFDHPVATDDRER
jgi:hypothetical protein